jgi:hypothetical protein
MCSFRYDGKEKETQELSQTSDVLGKDSEESVRIDIVHAKKDAQSCAKT